MAVATWAGGQKEDGMLGRLLGVVVPWAVVMALCVPVGAEEKKTKPKYSSATGKITAVDAGAKTITVKTRKGEKVVALGAKTPVIKLTSAKIADMVKGALVRVEGKVAEDQKSVAARRISIYPKEMKPRGKGISKSGALGTVEGTGEALSVKTAEGKALSVKLVEKPRPTLVLKAAKAAFADLKEGCEVQCNTAVTGDKLRATRVTIRPPKPAPTRAKKPKLPPGEPKK